MKKVLVATTDLSSARMALDCLRALVNCGVEMVINVIADGKSVGIWQRAGETHPEVDLRFTPIVGDDHNKRQVDELCNIFDPEIVMTGLSAPAEMEQWVQKRAWEKGVPIVVLEDIFGGHTRVAKGVVPNLIITADKISADISRKMFPRTPQVIWGNPSLVEAHRLLSPAGQEEIDRTKRYIEKVKSRLPGVTDSSCVITVVLCAQEPDVTLDMIKLLGGYLATFAENTFLVFSRFHPKLPAQFNNIQELRYWSACSPIRNHLVEQWVGPDGITTDQLVVCCDTTITGFSSVAYVAGAAGKLVLVPDTRTVLCEIQKWCGSLERNPLMGTLAVGVRDFYTQTVWDFQPSDLDEYRKRQKCFTTLPYNREDILADAFRTLLH